MISTVRLDNNNYIIDKSTGEIIDRYDPANKNVELHLTLPESILVVDGENIVQEYGGNIIVQYNDDRYIIDDGFANTLIKCGYIVYKDYDVEHKVSPSVGKTLRNSIIESIRELLPGLAKKYNIKGSDLSKLVTCEGNESIVYIGNESDHFTYMIKFNTVNFIVNKNHIRKDNSLSFYPFDKSMDKYGTIYLSVFAQKNFNKFNDPDKYSIPDAFIRDLVSQLGIDYHYISLPIKSRVIYWNGL